MHSYDVLYVISDLHLGGLASTAKRTEGDPIPVQACGAGDRLALFVQHLTEKASKGRQIGLVINGDFIDFLAENPTQYLNFDDPAKHVQRVARDGAFRGFFDALKALLKEASVRLVIVIGNHDVEFLHPDTQEALCEILGSPPATRLVFAIDGTGYHCTVGGRTVYCTHGNEHDAWNLLDHRKLRRLLRRVKSGTCPRQEEIAAVTNAGTRLVIDVMNEVKTAHPFVDLLKPEIEAMVPILSSLKRGDQAFQVRLQHVLPLLSRRVIDAVRVRQGLLGEADPADPGAHVNEPLPMTPQPPDWDEIEDAYQQDVSPTELALRDGAGTLGLGAASAGIVRTKFESDGLRKYLLSVAMTDDTFSPANFDDSTFRSLDGEIDPRTDFIIAGHTHLARQIRRRSGKGWYFNSGTWMRLLRLRRPILESEQTWQEVERVLTGPDLSAIEAWRWGGAPAGTKEHHRMLMMDRCTVVRIEYDPAAPVPLSPPGEVTGSLLVVKANGEFGKDEFEPEPARLSPLKVSR